MEQTDILHPQPAYRNTEYDIVQETPGVGVALSVSSKGRVISHQDVPPALQQTPNLTDC